MAVVESGRPAVTHYRVHQRFSYHTHLRVRLETGRTHQIRVHMASIGQPIVGDPLYGARRLPKDAPSAARLFPRQALHATQISFLHPMTGENLCYASAIAPDMSELIAALA
jgi:23S rRNA pseudouridine1911/1915/1917 synthase